MTRPYGGGWAGASGKRLDLLPGGLIFAPRAGHTDRVSRRISSPELIGRAAEVAALVAALADAQRGRGRLVLIEGDSGIGKTRLVEDFTARMDEARVLAGGGIPLASDAPYAPVVSILQALVWLHPEAA